MIVHEFSLPVKQVRIDTYYFRLMLVLVIPQIEISVIFYFTLRLHFVLDVTRISYLQINWVFEGRKKSKTFWVSVLVEARAAQDTDSCMPPTLKMPYHKWDGLIFTSGLLP